MASNLADSYMNESNKIDGSNYVNWKFEVQTLLEAAMAWNIVIGQEEKSEDPTNSIQDWEHRENKAKVLLRMSMKDNIISHIRECNTSTITWNTLKGLYETSNSNRILFLKTKLLSIKMEEREEVNNYISRIKDLRDKLSDIGEKVSNSDLVTIKLKGMLAEYQMFTSSLVA